MDYIPKDMVNLDKLSYYSDIVLLNSTRCEEIPLSLLLLINRSKGSFLAKGFGSKCSSYNLSGSKNFTDAPKGEGTIRLGKTLKNFIHQRLNVGHLIFLNTASILPLRNGIRLVGLSFSTKAPRLQILAKNINKNSLSENKDIFNQWLVGFTDGDGSFSIVRQNDKWSLTYIIGQSTYNLRILHFIKKQLGSSGSIYIEKDRAQAHFRIRDLVTLEKVIFPIFDKYPLLTTKYFKYLKFKEAHSILSNTSYTKSEKDSLIFKILDSKPDILPYISPAWSIVNYKVFNYETASQVMSKSWLVGFTEAEGSFYLVSKSKDKIVSETVIVGRIIHAFEITQKLDEIVLIAIKHLLHINTNVQFKKAGYYTIVTTNSRAIENIICYFKNTFKGMKAVEYRIWARSYLNDKGNYLALRKIRDNIRIMKARTNSN
uniref:hypothetical protein n=1 Tax=Porodaedalea mongolica TaxID=2651638 RepID=UPI0021AD4100|nr:hypothetical protein NYK79_mgp39 [Porodaedalea mongolica]UUA03951.1 hypothetical protein [Porodaedalea mongolica]